jgi:hypothetical protein
VYRKKPPTDTIVSGSYTTLLFQTRASVKIDVQIDHDATLRTKRYNVMETFSKKNATLLHTTKLPSKCQNIRKHNKIIKHTAYVSLSLHVKLGEKQNIDCTCLVVVMN